VLGIGAVRMNSVGIHDDGLASLCAELRSILAVELVAGNRIERISCQPGDWPLVVVLSDPFRSMHEAVPESPIRFREINNRRLWKAHYVCLDHAQILACGFDGEV
jgi:hypothetical protein